MGQSISKLFDSIFGKKDARILMIGLDAAGKSTILYRLKLGKVVSTVPTMGFNVETVEYKNIRFTVWDIGAQTKIRTLYRVYLENTQGLIFVVDSSDKEKERIELAKEELHKMLAVEEMKETALLVFANKQDSAVMSVDEVTEKLELSTLDERDWHVQGTCAMTGDGLFEGLEWLSKTLNKKKSFGH